MDRMLAEPELAEAEAAVAQGKRHFKKQLGKISELERDGHDTVQAVDLCGNFQDPERPELCRDNELAACFRGGVLQ